MKKARLSWIAVVTASVVIVAGVPLHADILITVDGQEIVTEGPWEVDGRRIVYRNEAGHLTMIRASNVDLEASRKATEEANRPPEPEPEGPVVPDSLALLAAQLKEATESGDAAMVLTDEKMGSGTAFGMLDFQQVLESLDPETLQAVMADVMDLAFEVLEMHQRHDLTTPQGAQQAAPSLKRLAERFDRKARSASGQHREVLTELAKDLHRVADQARNNPAAFAREFAEESGLG